LFYCITIIFIIIAVLGDSQIFFYYFIAAALSGIIGYIFQRKQKSQSPVNRRYIITLFILWIPGIFFTGALYHLIFVMASNSIPDPSAFSTDGVSLIMIILGPLLLLASTIIFIISLIKTKKIK
jgi:hypothetical protein